MSDRTVVFCSKHASGAMKSNFSAGRSRSLRRSFRAASKASSL